jgi:amino acid transporter
MAENTDSPQVMAAAPGGTGTKNQLGTFGGVFTPSILTILGVILFMRSGFVTGRAGFFEAMLILLLAKSITALTSLSISAVSTNTPVAGGGAYFLISRALGPETGGAIGISLYMAQAISVPFYVLGFTEALVRTAPGLAEYFQPIAIATGLVLFVVAYSGAGWATRAQYLIMGVLALSLVVMLGGLAWHFQYSQLMANWKPQYTDPENGFWKMFSIYFPAVTGIMTGVNMSGDLKDPGKSIPRGTFMAVGVGFLIYALQIFLNAGALNRIQLIETSFEAYQDKALFGAGILVSLGVFAATLSSGLGSLLGAPRVLQALARDEIIPKLGFFAAGTGPAREPRRGLWLTLFITVSVIFLSGDSAGGTAFDILAAVVTMFFLYTYGMVNMAAFVESYGQNPSFRPRFRYYHWLTALAGSAGCIGTAFLIHPQAALGAVIVVGAIFFGIRQRVLKTRFGDARWGFYFSRLRNNLLQLKNLPLDSKNWRPAVLAFSASPKTRNNLVRYAVWLGANRGIVTVAYVITGELKDPVNLRNTARDGLANFLEANGLVAFPEVVTAPNLQEAVSVLLQSHSIGPIKPNLVIWGLPSSTEKSLDFVRLLRTAEGLTKSLVVLKAESTPEPGGAHRIDIWWRGRRNGSLMVVLAHLLSLNWEWSDCRIRLIRLIEDERGRQPSKEALGRLVQAARIDAQTQVIVSEKPFPEVFQRHSQDATAVFLGLQLPEDGKELSWHQNLIQMLEEMPPTFLVDSNGQVDLRV